MKPNSAPAQGELIKLRAVIEMVALSRSSIYAEIRNGTFPRQVRQTTRSVAWVRSEVLTWVEEKRRARK